jgi:hypothetical protein
MAANEMQHFVPFRVFLNPKQLQPGLVADQWAIEGACQQITHI